MKTFQIKDMDIATGGILVAILNEKDAQELDLHVGDRLLLSAGRNKVNVILDIAENKKVVAPGQIGVFEEVLKRLCLQGKSRGRSKNKSCPAIKVKFSGKPESVQHIRAKMHGKKLCYTEILHIIDDITNDRLTDVEKTYFVAAGFTHGWSDKEIVDMTRAMVETGDKLKFRGITLDKHCIGGVPNNRTTMIVTPIIAAAGLTMPKTSSRAITSPAGTADTMECLAKVELSQKKIHQVIKKTGACIVHGGSMNLAPADDKIIQVEHPLSIDAEGQLIASVMAKKYSVTANHVLIDIPMGEEVKVKNPTQARKLRKKFEKVGKALKMDVKVIVTDGSEPIGNGVGPLLEAQDVLAILKNEQHAPEDLRKKALNMAATLLEMSKKVKKGKGFKTAEEILFSGKAWKKMQEIIKAQGKQTLPTLGRYKYQVRASKSGTVKELSNGIIAKLARIAGAPKDKGAGLYLHKKVGQQVKRGDLLFTLYAQSKAKQELALELLKEKHPYLIR